MSTATYTVVGMTCAHCANSVTKEVSQLAGVSDVQVDLACGALTVISVADIDDAAVRAAVEEAGYQVAGPPNQAVAPGLPVVASDGQRAGCGCGCGCGCS